MVIFLGLWICFTSAGPIWCLLLIAKMDLTIHHQPTNKPCLISAAIVLSCTAKERGGAGKATHETGWPAGGHSSGVKNRCVSCAIMFVMVSNPCKVIKKNIHIICCNQFKLNVPTSFHLCASHRKTTCPFSNGLGGTRQETWTGHAPKGVGPCLGFSEEQLGILYRQIFGLRKHRPTCIECLGAWHAERDTRAFGWTKALCFSLLGNQLVKKFIPFLRAIFSFGCLGLFIYGSVSVSIHCALSLSLSLFHCVCPLLLLTPSLTHSLLPPTLTSRYVASIIFANLFVCPHLCPKPKVSFCCFSGSL